MNIPKYDLFELTLHGPSTGNPFADVELAADFCLGGRKQRVYGFYDGAGIYKLRFMPDDEGEWTYTTLSNANELNGVSGSLTCVAAREGVHGPVVVDHVAYQARPAENGFPGFYPSKATRFAYADGANYSCVGTTCYVWNHQGDALEELTLHTLAKAPFNKIRMCVFPKHYDFNHNEPENYPFEGGPKSDGTFEWDFTRFNPEYFRHLELCVAQLGELGIEADIILFHPYDNWGFQSMTHEVDMAYLRYVVARLSAYRNVWWSLANEYDLMRAKKMSDWDDFFKLIAQRDHVGHLRSVHNCFQFYDHSKPWVTHASIQSADLPRCTEWMNTYNKPVVIDECCYEGNITHEWGNITAQEMVNRFWIGFAQGAYVGHGETYMDENDVLWWAKGGALHGESPKRIAFLRKIMEELPGRPLPVNGYRRMRTGMRIDDDFFLLYFDIRQQIKKRLSLPEDKSYRIEIIDAWNCTITPIDGTFSGNCEIDMPGLPYQAVRITRV